jgi:hypothetical protein
LLIVRRFEFRATYRRSNIKSTSKSILPELAQSSGSVRLYFYASVPSSAPAGSESRSRSAESTNSIPTIVGREIYYDWATVLQQFSVLHDPQSLLSQLCTLATHPVTMARALTRKIISK